MLRELHIRNFAVVESLDLEFEEGMTVFTGETGAGKSIIVDALGMILGDRGDSSVVRNDQGKTEISAVFNVASNTNARALLGELDIEPEHGEVIVRRTIHQEGRSRGFINGTPATIQQLKQLGESLVELHGQHSHQSLLKGPVQRSLLDNYGDYQPTLDRVRDLHGRWCEIQSALKALSGNTEDREARVALLQYQVEELEDMNLGKSEFTELEARFRQLSHVNEILETIETARSELCTGEQSALDRCSAQVNALSRLQSRDEKLGPLVELVNNAIIQLEEANSGLRNYLDNLDTDPQSLADTEQRLNRIMDVARKHHVQPETLYEHGRRLRQELTQLQDSTKDYQALLAEEQSVLDEYRKSAKQLNKLRLKTATKLGEAVTQLLGRLGMPAATFDIRVDYQANDTPASAGLDRIEFLFTANPGQALKPLTKVASGGELSRVSLAIQVTSTDQLNASSLVFDEVDSGVGGATAEIVGKLLHQLSGNYQVFCVTHLAQVAAFGTSHFHVSKIAGNNITRTQVRRLDGNSRVEEIARMMGGVKITEQSLAHAREMLNAVR